MIRRIAYLLFNKRTLFFPFGAFSAYRAVFININTGDICHRPCCELTVTMFTKNIGMNIMYVNSTIVTQKIPESGTIENCTRNDYTSFFPSRPFQSYKSKNINRIAHNNHNPFTVRFGDIFCNTPDYISIFLNQLQPRFTRLLSGSGSNYNNLSIGTCLLYTSDAADEEDSVD